MALRVGKFAGNGPGLWLRMQQAYDLWHAETRMADELSKIETIATEQTARLPDLSDTGQPQTKENRADQDDCIVGKDPTAVAVPGNPGGATGMIRFLQRTETGGLCEE